MAIKKTSVEMTDEQMELFNALTKLQQAVCLNLIKGHSNIDSYKKAKGATKVKQATAESTISRMLKNNKVIKSLAVGRVPYKVLIDN